MGKCLRIGHRSKFFENILLNGVYLNVGLYVLCSKLFCQLASVLQIEGNSLNPCYKIWGVIYVTGQNETYQKNLV